MDIASWGPILSLKYVYTYPTQILRIYQDNGNLYLQKDL